MFKVLITEFHCYIFHNKNCFFLFQTVLSITLNINFTLQPTFTPFQKVSLQLNDVRCQFHQHFTRTFFVRNYLPQQLFSNFSSVSQPVCRDALVCRELLPSVPPIFLSSWILLFFSKNVNILVGICNMKLSVS